MPGAKLNVQEPRTNRARSQADGLNRKTTETIFVRPAAVDDVPAIVALVNSYARQGTVLPRTTTAVYMSIDDWLVAESGGELSRRSRAVSGIGNRPEANGRVVGRSQEPPDTQIIRTDAHHPLFPANRFLHHR